MEPATPRKTPHKKPPLPLKKPKITFWEPMLPEGSKEEEIAMNVMQELTSMDLGGEGVESEKEILRVLKNHLNDYKKIPENEQDPEFKKNLEKDITIFQNYVNNQSGGRRRKRKTRKKRGGNIDIERDAYIYRLIQPLHLSLQDQIDRHNTRIQELEQWQEAYEDLNLEERIVALESLRSGTGGTGGGKRKKKTRKKKAGHHEPLLLAAVAASKLINKKRKKKYKKKRTKKKSSRVR